MFLAVNWSCSWPDTLSPFLLYYPTRISRRHTSYEEYEKGTSNSKMFGLPLSFHFPDREQILRCDQYSLHRNPMQNGTSGVCHSAIFFIQCAFLIPQNLTSQCITHLYYRQEKKSIHSIQLIMLVKYHVSRRSDLGEWQSRTVRNYVEMPFNWNFSFRFQISFKSKQIPNWLFVHE